MRFEDFYPRDAAAAYCEHLIAPMPEDDDKAALEAWRTHGLQLEEVLSQALGRYLLAMRDAGQLQPIPHLERRVGPFHFTAKWNAMVAGGSPNETVLGLIRYSIGWTASLAKYKQPVNADYLYRLVESGNFEWNTMGDARVKCHVTGETLEVQLTGWQAQLGRRRHEAGRGHYFEPLAGDAPAPTVDTIRIPAPSGELLIADWFRLENNEFTKAVKEGQQSIEVNSEAGMRAQTQQYAALGFASVFVGNTGPAILQIGDDLLIGRQPVEEKKSHHHKGSVCTDLWWATIIDRQVLTDILAARHGVDRASTLISGYLAKPSTVCTIVRVPPGELHVNYVAGGELRAGFTCDDPLASSIDALDDCFAVVSARPMQWRQRAAAEEHADGEKVRPRPGASG